MDKIHKQRGCLVDVAGLMLLRHTSQGKLKFAAEVYKDLTRFCAMCRYDMSMKAHALIHGLQPFRSAMMEL